MGRLKLRQGCVPQFAVPRRIGQEEAWSGLERRVMRRAVRGGGWESVRG